VAAKYSSKETIPAVSDDVNATHVPVCADRVANADVEALDETAIISRTATQTWKTYVSSVNELSAIDTIEPKRCGQRTRRIKSMSARPGQGGSVYRHRKNWIGQWLEDATGVERRVRKSLTLGLVSKMTKSEARRALQEHLNKLGVNTQEHLERSQRPVQTFAQAADKYEDGRLIDLKPSTRRSSEYHLRKYLRPMFGEMLVDDITAAKVSDAVRTWAKKESLARNTLRNLVTTLGSVIGKNFGKAIKYPSQVEVRPDENEAPCFTPQQMASIVSHANDAQMKAFFATAAGTGMRSGELCGLRIEDVDLDYGIISVRRSSWEGTEQTPKTKNAIRKIGIDAEVVRILREHIGRRRIGYVFQARNGSPLRESNVLRRELHPILEELKIPKCGLHAFRHGRVSFLVENNVPLPVIRLWIGHSSDQMVARYTHARPQFHANIIASLPSIANMQTSAA
jgi:integrase